MNINKLISPYNHDLSTVDRLNGGYLVIHFVGALGGAKANCEYFAGGDRGASSHYFVDFDGSVWQSVEDKNIAWHCGSSSYKHPHCRNGNSIAVELCVRKRNTASLSIQDTDWYFEDATVRAAAELTGYLADKYNIPADHVVRHYDVTGKMCPEPFVRNNTEHTWDSFLAAVQAERAETPNADAVLLRGMTAEEFIEYIGAKATEDQKKNGILAALTVAQAMLESANGKSELACGLGASGGNIAVNGTAYGARNLFGMKTDISAGTWKSTAWNGQIYRKMTSEQNADGSYTDLRADFRSYDTIDQSIEDHAQYLTQARLSGGGAMRYPGIVGETDYIKAIDILCAGGYATSQSYRENLISRIKQYDLCRYNYRPESAYESWTAKVVNADALNVRRTPNGEIMDLDFPALPAIVVIGEALDSDGDIWYRVQVGSAITGYVWPEYLSA